MSRATRVAAWILVGCVIAATPVALGASSVAFTVHRNSQATFRTDAPLEAVVGTTAGSGTVTGSVTVDLARPQQATGEIRVDLATLKTGIANRDAHMVGPDWLDVQNEVNRYAVFKITAIEVTGALEAGREVPGKVKGVLTIRQKAVDTTVDARIAYLKLSSTEAEALRRAGYGPEILRVRAKLRTSFTNHGMQVPQLYFLRVSNEIQLDVDLTLTR
jgi:polyisoprenoid-binding protein YceI